MKTKITYEDLVAMRPCYAPGEIGIHEGYSTSIPGFINDYRDKVKAREDIIWVLCRNDYMTDRDLRLFAVWCARKALELVDNPDERSVNACNVAERYARGEASDEELRDARSAARDAAWYTARDAAWYAARDAAWAAARDAAWAAAWAAARDAAWYAARDAAWYAAWDDMIDKLLTFLK